MATATGRISQPPNAQNLPGTLADVLDKITERMISVMRPFDPKLVVIHDKERLYIAEGLKCRAEGYRGGSWDAQVTASGANTLNQVLASYDESYHLQVEASMRAKELLHHVRQLRIARREKAS